MSSYISNRELDELGNGLVRRYLERSGMQGAERCIDIEGLANFLGLTVVYEQLNKIAARWPATAVAQFYFIDK